MEIKKLEKFVGRDWSNMLLPFFNSKEWKHIESQIRELKKQGHVLTPLPENWFRVFQLCPYYSLHTIILTDKQYDYLDPTYGHVADGIAFSAKDTNYVPAALENLFFGIDENYVPKFFNDKYACDLAPWVKQGVLLLNCEITTTVKLGNNLTHDHYNMWKPFIEYVLEKCFRWKSKLTVGFIGEKCVEHQEWLSIADFTCISAPSPSYTHVGKDKWEHNNFFQKIINSQKANNIEIDFKL